MSTEHQKQTKQISSGTLSPVLSEMQKVITEFKDGMSDYIDKILKEKLPPSTQPYDQEGKVSLLAPVDRKTDPELQHIPPTLEQNGVGFTDTSPKIITDIASSNTSSLQTSKDIGSPQTNKDVGTCIKIITDVGSGVNKDDSSSVGELFRNRKRHLPNADANGPTAPPPIKMSWKILGQVEDNFSVLDKEGHSVDTELAKKIENVFFESIGDNIKLQKIMKEYKHPANLLNLKPLKINPEIESSQQYQSNTSFVINNEKSLYSSQNYVMKAIVKCDKLNFKSFRC